MMDLPLEVIVTATRVPEDERWALERIPAGQAGRYIGARRRLVSGWRASQERGDPICHMAVAANGTGLLPDAPIGHRPVVRLIELPEVLCPTQEGGILSERGILDIPVVIHTPHHLCGAETALSILCAGLLRVPTGSAEVYPRVDMVAVADRDLKAGQVLGVPGGLGYSLDLRAALAPAFSLSPGAPVPFFMLEGRRLTADVPQGKTITLEMIEQPADSALWSLRGQQDAQFLSGRDMSRGE